MTAPNTPEFHGFWPMIGLTEQTYDEKVQWLSEERELRDSSIYFFHHAGILYGHARADYRLSNAAFFHAVIGLERALRLHYRREDESESLEVFTVLFKRAVEEELVRDDLFRQPKRLPELLTKNLKQLPAEHCLRLATLVPQWRNDYFHGQPVLAPELFFVALNLREIADVLDTAPWPIDKPRAAGPSPAS